MRPNLKGIFMMIFRQGEILRGLQSLHSDSRKSLLVVNHFFLPDKLPSKSYFFP